MIVLLKDLVTFFGRCLYDCVSSCELPSSMYRSFLQTTTRPPLSAGLMTMSSLDFRCLRAAHSCGLFFFDYFFLIIFYFFIFYFFIFFYYFYRKKMPYCLLTEAKQTVVFLSPSPTIHSTTGSKRSSTTIFEYYKKTLIPRIYLKHLLLWPFVEIRTSKTHSSAQTSRPTTHLVPFHVTIIFAKHVSTSTIPQPSLMETELLPSDLHSHVPHHP